MEFSIEYLSGLYEEATSQRDQAEDLATHQFWHERSIELRKDMAMVAF